MSHELTAEELAWFTIDPKEAITDLLAGIATLAAERDQWKSMLESERDEQGRAWAKDVAMTELRAQRDALRAALEAFICLGHQGNPQQERCGGAWGYEEPNTWNSICVRAREALGGKS